MSTRGYIMVVEDNDEDMEAIDRILARRYPGLEVRRVTDGARAVELLTALEGELPRLVLLDLGLGELPGRETLAGIRTGVRSSQLPVVVLTGSTDSAEVEACYAAGASGYLFKSLDLALLEQTLDAGLRYWLVAVPPHEVSTAPSGRRDG